MRRMSFQLSGGRGRRGGGDGRRSGRRRRGAVELANGTGAALAVGRGGRVAGELAEEVRHHVHHHLDACPDCQQAFEFHLELKQAIRRKCSEDALPDSLISRLEVCLTEDFDGDGVIGDEGCPLR